MTDSKLAIVRDTLGTPSCDLGSAVIYTGDCLDFLRSLPSDIVNLTITSPPYNIGKKYEAVREVDEYVSWCGEWMSEIYRVTAPDGAFWLNLGYIPVPNKAKALPLPYLLWDKSPFQLVQETVWNYGAGVAAKTMFSPRNEKYLWYVKTLLAYTFNLDAVRDPNVKYPNQKKHGKIRVNQIGKNPTDVWQIPKVTTGENMTGRRASPERTPHPAQFPEAVIDRIIKACSNPGDLVLDPFIGSGTTAVVAVANGRQAVGFEIRPEYVSVACARMRKRLQAMSQGTLFEVT
ncbi:MAG: DNA-methyltransferase [Dehalococcoidia bacterium]